jgi:hypothetical protein
MLDDTFRRILRRTSAAFRACCRHTRRKHTRRKHTRRKHTRRHTDSGTDRLTRRRAHLAVQYRSLYRSTPSDAGAKQVVIQHCVHNPRRPACALQHIDGVGVGVGHRHGHSPGTDTAQTRTEAETRHYSPHMKPRASPRPAGTARPAATLRRCSPGTSASHTPARTSHPAHTVRVRSAFIRLIHHATTTPRGQSPHLVRHVDVAQHRGLDALPMRRDVVQQSRRLRVQAAPAHSEQRDSE